MIKSDHLTVGKIVGVHGIMGTMKVHSYAESPAVFQPGDEIEVIHKSGETSALRINWVRPHGKVLLMAVDGIDERTQAQKWIGSELLIKKSLLPTPEEGTYYWFDLIGLMVFTGDNEYLGRIDSIIPTGSNDVYVVKKADDGDRREILIPALESVVTSVDIEKGTMKVSLPEGL